MTEHTYIHARTSFYVYEWAEYCYDNANGTSSAVVQVAKTIYLLLIDTDTGMSWRK